MSGNTVTYVNDKEASLVDSALRAAYDIIMFGELVT